MVKRFKRHRPALRPESIYSIPIKTNKEIRSNNILHHPVIIPLTEEDQIIYVYEEYPKGKIIEVVNVSYQTMVENKWVTLLRFDSQHGFLHGYLRFSIEKDQEVPLAVNLKTKEDPHAWLTWAIEHLKDRYLSYKSEFFDRSLLDNITL